nr:hypothetical protein [uncultured Aminipila sp.]
MELREKAIRLIEQSIDIFETLGCYTVDTLQVIFSGTKAHFNYYLLGLISEAEYEEYNSRIINIFDRKMEELENVKEDG